MSDHDQPVAANLLARRFEAELPNQRWVGDTTELRIGESGRLFRRHSSLDYVSPAEYEKNRRVALVA